MKTIFKSYKFRIDPTKDQQVLLSKHFGACRFIFNHYLNERKDEYLNNKNTLNYHDNANNLTQLKKDENYIWLKEINSQSLQSTLKHLDISYNRFFRRQSKFPKFKNKYTKQSFTIPQSITIEEEQLWIPKFKQGIKIKLHREIEGKIMFGTISKTVTNKYYISMTCEVQHQQYEKTNSNVGIDTGLKDLAILSDGKVYENIKTLKKNLKKLKFNQRQFSKKQKESKNRLDQKLKVAILHERITNVRRDYLHKVTTEIVKNHDIICIEDLAVKNLMKNHKLALSFADVGLGELYSMLEYKSNWNDKTVIMIDRFFPSSKMCNICNYIKDDLTLKDREWTCPSCNTNHNRDLNASLNILNQGLKILSGSGIESDIKQKQGESSSVEEVVNLETTTSLV